MYIKIKLITRLYVNIAISAQQSLAVYLFLSTSVDAFKEPYLTKRILKRLVEQDIYWSISQKQAETNEYSLYEKGQPANHFTLVLEGKLQVSLFFASNYSRLYFIITCSSAVLLWPFIDKYNWYSLAQLLIYSLYCVTVKIQNNINDYFNISKSAYNGYSNNGVYYYILNV